MSLVLTRREGEEIVIGSGADTVVVRISRIRGDKVRVAVEAPLSVSVHRREVLEEVRAKAQSSKAQSSNGQMPDASSLPAEVAL